MTFKELQGAFPRFKIITDDVEKDFIFYKEEDRYDGAVNAYRIDNNIREPAIFSSDCQVIEIKSVIKDYRIGEKVKAKTYHSVKGEATLSPGDICEVVDIDNHKDEFLYFVRDAKENLWILEENDLFSAD